MPAPSTHQGEHDILEVGISTGTYYSNLDIPNAVAANSRMMLCREPGHTKRFEYSDYPDSPFGWKKTPFRSGLRQGREVEGMRYTVEGIQGRPLNAGHRQPLSLYFTCLDANGSWHRAERAEILLVTHGLTVPDADRNAMHDHGNTSLSTARILARMNVQDQYIQDLQNRVAALESSNSTQFRISQPGSRHRPSWIRQRGRYKTNRKPMEAFQIAEVHALLRRHGIHDLMRVRAGKNGIDVFRQLDDPRAQDLRDYHITRKNNKFAAWSLNNPHDDYSRADTPAKALERTMARRCTS